MRDNQLTGASDMNDTYLTPPRNSKLMKEDVGILEGDVDREALFRQWKVSDTQVKTIDLSNSYGGHGGRYCAIIDGFLTPEECSLLVDLVEQKEWEAALLNETKIEDIRKSKRVMIDDTALADLLYQRILLALGVPDGAPRVMYNKLATRMNNRFRFLKYTEGDYFKTHMDGSYQTPDGKERSMLTVQLYLNDGDGVDCTGGETNMYEPDSQTLLYPVVPKTGRCLLFDHRTLHEGALVSSGVKYAVRNDLMYDLST